MLIQHQKERSINNWDFTCNDPTQAFNGQKWWYTVMKIQFTNQESCFGSVVIKKKSAQMSLRKSVDMINKKTPRNTTLCKISNCILIPKASLIYGSSSIFLSFQVLTKWATHRHQIQKSIYHISSKLGHPSVDY